MLGKIKEAIPAQRVARQCESNWHDGGGLGWRPGMTKRFEGMGRGQEDRIRYEKGYARMKGLCTGCKQYKGKKAKQGEHCKIERCDK